MPLPNVIKSDSESSEHSDSNESESSTELSDDEYEVEKLVGKRYEDGVWKYKVRWVGYGPEEDTWVKVDDLVSTQGTSQIITRTGSRPSKKNLSTSFDSTKLPKKSLKRPQRSSSSPEINENDDENSCEIIFDKSDTIKPSKAKKAKKVAVVSSDSEDEDVENLPSKSKKKKKKQTPSKSNSIDETDVGPSSKQKKPKTDKKNGEGSTAALGDKTLPQNPKKKKPETPKNVNTLEKAFAKSNPERFFKPKENKNDDDAESVSDASVCLVFSVP
uniref:Chromo domain-containing protein n=1 Tax=Panagrolaimus davidi TaxID=227884 RepID=A0A914QQH8_9BILA